MPGIWRTLDDFSSGAVCMVLASEGYDETDYIRDYADFLNLKQTLYLTDIQITRYEHNI